MTLNAFPMESGFSGYDEYENPIFDRAVSSAFYRRFWSKYFTNGIFYEPADNFKVSPKNGMEISVKLGECHIQGVTAMPEDEAYEIIRLDDSSITADRTDRIVLRADFENDRSVSIQVYKDWIPATDSLVRKADIWELAIADVHIKKGASSVTAADITDLRLDTELCGVVTEPFTRTNTEAFFSQLTAEMQRIGNEWSEQKDNQQGAFDTQLTEQESAYQTAMSEIDAWYAGIKADIGKAQTFDFDNIASITGVTRTAEFATDKITEVIKITASGVKVAERITTFSGIVVTAVTTIFDTDGATVIKNVTSTANIGASITETVV